MENNTYLVHYGIKGMHWGIRRYQNPDGSLTEAGQRRYDKQENKRKENYAKAKDSKTYRQLLKRGKYLTNAEYRQQYDKIRKRRETTHEIKEAMRTNDGRKPAKAERARVSRSEAKQQRLESKLNTAKMNQSLNEMKRKNHPAIQRGHDIFDASVRAAGKTILTSALIGIAGSVLASKGLWDEWGVNQPNAKRKDEEKKDEKKKDEKKKK